MRLYIILLLISMISAKLIQMETRSMGSMKTNLIRSGDWPKFLENRENSRISKLSSGSKPMNDYMDNYYLGRVSVGNPPQTMSVVMDTGSSDFWVTGSGSNMKCILLDAPVFNFTKTFFNPSISNTFAWTKENFTILYLSGAANGTLGTDTLILGDSAANSFVVINQTVGVANSIANVTKCQPMDGILGLAWPSIVSTNNTTPVMQMLLPQLDLPLFTVWLDRKIIPSSGGQAGLITFGGFDRSNCQMQNITYHPLSATTYWQFTIDKVQISKYYWILTKAQGQAISDTGTSYIGCPSTFYNYVTDALNAVWDPINQMDTVKCDAMKHANNVYITIGGIIYSIPPYEMIIDLGLGNNKCGIAFFPLYTESNGFSPTWILGDVWIRTYCNVYDIGNQRIGFARALHPGISSSEYPDTSASSINIFGLIATILFYAFF